MITSESIKKAENFVDTTLNGKRSGKAGFWEHVEEIMAFLYDAYAIQMIDLEHAAKMERETSLNKFHSNKGMSERTIGAIPPWLTLIIDKVYGEDIPYPSQQPMWREFFKRYPQFSYTSKL